MKILNAFSLSMIPHERGAIEVFPLTLGEVKAALEDAAVAAEFGGDPIESCVGHADTAALFSGILGVPLKVNRVSILLRHEEGAIVGQYVGPRLPEGATSLPEGAEIRWILIRWISAAVAAREAVAIAASRLPGPDTPRSPGPMDQYQEAVALAGAFAGNQGRK